MRINLGIFLTLISVCGMILFNLMGWNTTVFFIMFGVACFNFDHYVGGEKRKK